MTAESVDRDFVERLIKLLERDESLRARMAQLFSPFEFVKRDELAEVLKEIRALLKEHSERVKEMNERFEAMQKQMDKRFEESNRRFEALTKEMNERFEAMQKQMDERFEESNRRFEALTKEMNERFEAMQKQIDERFEQVFARFETADKRFEALQNIIISMQADMAHLSSKYGKRAEDAARKLLMKILREGEGIDTARIRHIQIEDRDGTVFHKGFTTDIDIYYEGAQTWIIEYKARADRDNVEHLHLVRRLLREQYRINPDRVLMVALNVNDDVLELAKEVGIEIIHGIASNPTFLPPPSA